MRWVLGWLNTTAIMPVAGDPAAAAAHDVGDQVGVPRADDDGYAALYERGMALVEPQPLASIAPHAANNSGTAAEW